MEYGTISIKSGNPLEIFLLINMWVFQTYDRAQTNSQRHVYLTDKPSHANESENMGLYPCGILRII